jgi:hypothetical protein
MKAYLMTVLVVDYKDCGFNDIKYYLENAEYISPNVVSVREADIGEWDYNHPLNSYATRHDAIKAYFPE